MNEYSKSLCIDIDIRIEIDFVLDQPPFPEGVFMNFLTDVGIGGFDEALLCPDLAVSDLRVVGIELTVNRDLVVAASVTARSNIDPLVLGFAEIP